MAPSASKRTRNSGEPVTDAVEPSERTNETSHHSPATSDATTPLSSQATSASDPSTARTMASLLPDVFPMVFLLARDTRRVAGGNALLLATAVCPFNHMTRPPQAPPARGPDAERSPERIYRQTHPAGRQARSSLAACA